MKISYTTSGKCNSFNKGGEASDQVDANGDPIAMKINFWRDRSCFNKIFFLIYKVNRIVFISIYFYFFPPFSIFLNFCLPFVFRNQYKAAWVTLGENAGMPGY